MQVDDIGRTLLADLPNIPRLEKSHRSCRVMVKCDSSQFGEDLGHTGGVQNSGGAGVKLGVESTHR